MPIPDEFEITEGFPGTYERTGGNSWYLDGDRDADNVHFTVFNNDLRAWHLTYSLTGTNVGIWYHGADFNNVNTRNIPYHKWNAWVNWIDANWEDCDEAAADFYGQFG